MKPYSLDLRQKILEAYLNHEGSQRQLAKRFKVSLSFIQNLLKHYRESGEVLSYQVLNYDNKATITVLKRSKRTYSIDLSQKILEAYLNQEGSQRQLAKRFKVSPTYIRNLLKNYRKSDKNTLASIFIDSKKSEVFISRCTNKHPHTPPQPVTYKIER